MVVNADFIAGVRFVTEFFDEFIKDPAADSDIQVLEDVLNEFRTTFIEVLAKEIEKDD